MTTSPGPIDEDLRFGQVAVRMGMLAAQDLPRLMKEAREARAASKRDEK